MMVDGPWLESGFLPRMGGFSTENHKLSTEIGTNSAPYHIGDGKKRRESDENGRIR
jgi:hypothetical protein